MANELQRSKYNRTNSESEANINPENLQLWKKYEADMSIRELSAKTIYQYKRDIFQWFAYLVENQFNPSIKDVTEDDIEEFIFWCKNNGNNTERIKRRLSAISSFYIFLRRKRIANENPCEFIVRPKKGLPVVPQTYLTLNQYNDMIKALEENGDLQLLVYAVISIDTMARVNAISNITWEQIDFDERTINDVLEKEGYIVTLYFGNKSKELLLELKKQRKEEKNESPYVFLNVDGSQVTSHVLFDWCKKIGQMIGVSSLHPHDFRHSGSQLMNLNGAPIELISELLNHKSVDVTRNHYLQANKKKVQEQKDKFMVK